MEYLKIYSSVVFAGTGFSPSIFQYTDLHDMLGDPDIEKQIIVPIVLKQFFPKSNFKILITPERIDIGYIGEDFLPENMKKIARYMIKKLQQLPASKTTGLGINLAATIADQIIGDSGLNYCKNKLLKMKNLKDKLQYKRFLGNTGKLMYIIDNIRYTVTLEPNFQSNGKNLQLNINAHQTLDEKEELNSALSNYEKVKNYLIRFPDRFFE